jgi:plastocyanin
VTSIMSFRRLCLAASVVALLAGGVAVAGPVRSHAAVPECEGGIPVETVKDHAGVECTFHFVGSPIVAEGRFSTDNPALKSNFHVGVIAQLADGTRQPLPVECTDFGRSGDPNAACRVEWDPTGTGAQAVELPGLQDVVALICEAHSHAGERPWVGEYFGENAGGEFRCSSGPAGAGGGGDPGDGGSADGSAVAGAPAFVATPGSVFATNPAVVSRSAAAQASPVFANLDVLQHDVVAVEATRPDGSAPWCDGYGPGACPLFWSPLIGGAETTTVLGFDDAQPGTYEYYCSIHPFMVGTVQVV